jgi:hypothetical protein
VAKRSRPTKEKLMLAYDYPLLSVFWSLFIFVVVEA